MRKNYLLIIILVLFIFPISTFAINKSETVYVSLDGNGDIKKNSVNIKLSNLEKGEVVDYTDLTDIENVNGREKFSINSSRITWKSTGKDIYYKGVIDKELPIGVNINYYLNGEKVSLKDIEGSKGEVKIVYNFSNNSYDYNSGMYTPFVVSLVSLMSNKNDSNIRIDNGRVISTGNRNVVLGIAAPGLYDSFKLDELSSLDSLTIKYHTSKFSLDNVYFAITPKLLEEADISRLNNVNSLTGSLNLLQNGMNELESGSSTLNDGVKQLNNGAKALNKGLLDAYKGMGDLNSGINELNDKAVFINSLVIALKDIMDNSARSDLSIDEINRLEYEKQLINQIDPSILEKVNQLQTLYNSNNQAIQKLEYTNNSLVQSNGYTLKQIYDNNNLSNYKINESDPGSLPVLSDTLAPILLNQGMSSDEVLATITQLTTVKQTYESNLQLIELLKGNNQALLSSHDILGGVISKLDEVVNGTNSLADGSNQLLLGLEKLYNGSSSLSDGTNRISEGSTQLKNGINKINSEGIKRLTGYGTLINKYSDKVKTLVRLAKDYNGYSSNDVDNTLFIYKLS